MKNFEDFLRSVGYFEVQDFFYLTKSAGEKKSLYFATSFIKTAHKL